MTQQVSIEDFQRLSTLTASAALDAGQWQAVTDELVRLAPGARVHLFGQDFRRNYVGSFAGGHDPDFIRLYEEHYGALNPWVEALMSMPTGVVADTRAVLSDEMIEATEFYSGWVRPQEDIIASGGAVIEASDSSTVIFGANIRRRDRDRLMGRWLELCRLIVPQMQIAWTIGRRHLASDLEIVARGTMLAESPLAVLVAGPDGRIRYANETANAALAAGTAVAQDASGRLRFAAPEAAARFRRAAAALGRAQAFAAESFVLPAPPGPPQRYAFSALNPEVLGNWSMARLVRLDEPSLLVAMAEEPRAERPADILARQHGLTAAEAEVALQVAAGRRPREIAEARAVSVHTVRAQLKAAMAKCGTRRQAELAVLVARLAPDAP